MRNPIQGTQFKRDVKLSIKRGKDLSKLKTLMTLLIEDRPIPSEYKDHSLKGNWSHHRDSHIEPDWLLIYKVDGDDLYFVRTGTHADIFS
ncbi:MULTISPECIES: type II toxin-antitoxin system mRNA interferase toxin, RelE/StbE family [Legionella]|uniref:mRNA interferase YafQ n=1 Tax=Legionella drozanskii LLAP-1 TaxID=1212489 RepID=A0A0W0SM44_9GAMM|nr:MULTISPECIES: type II toxin-antitoxin system mRNA interferase toxin, RelE/StbE family [Legionella]KTC84380.1 mRNA interferase YafQ [Legionella drozanskii LLAP-1]PJE06869.1 MAG: type II toxin-antitoxin system mRNA interferase toxin, RelE/StbE family [Legionella sp.]